MCILSAITATDINNNVFRLLMHEMMLCSNVEYQRDGWGIANTSIMRKDTGNYARNNMSWYSEITQGPAIGHVRAASVGTSVSNEEAHPFDFPHWMCMHNGAFHPWEHEGKDPNSDSFHAFKKLHTLGQGELSPDIIEAWLSSFDTRTTFVCVFLEKATSNLIIVRGNYQKMLYAQHLGNGFMINTSPFVLDHMMHFGRLYGLPVSNTILGVMQNSMTVIRPGEHAVQVWPLNYQQLPAPFDAKAFLGIS